MPESSEQPARSRRLGTTLGVLALVLAVATVSLWIKDLRTLALPEDLTLYTAAFVLAVVLGIGAFVAGTRWYGGLAAVPGILIGALLTLTIAINEQTAADPIQVGDRIPSFTAVDELGKPFTSEALHGHLLLVKFFRAHW